MSAGLVPSGGSGESPLACPLQLPEATHVLWHMASHHVAFLSLLPLSHHLLPPATFLPPSLPSKDACDYTGEARLILHLQVLSLITSAESLLPWKVLYSQVPEIMMCAS